jgi:hypothetical protein
MRFYCPKCKKLTRCLVDRSGWSGEDSMYQQLEDIHYFRRRRVCQECEWSFETAEVYKGYIKEFVRLREENLTLLDRINTGLQTTFDLSNYLMLLNSRELIKQKLYHKFQVSQGYKSYHNIMKYLGEGDLQVEQSLDDVLGFHSEFGDLLLEDLEIFKKMTKAWNRELSKIKQSWWKLWYVGVAKNSEVFQKGCDLREELANKILLHQLGIAWGVAKKLISAIGDWPLDENLVLFDGLVVGDLLSEDKELISSVIPYIHKSESEQFPLDLENLQAGNLDDAVLYGKLSVGDLSEEVREIMDLLAEHKRLDEEILGISEQESTSYLENSKLFKKFIKCDDPNYVKEEKNNHEVGETVGEVQKERAKDESTAGEVKTNFTIDGEGINQDEVFRLWFKAISDEKSERQIADFIAGKTKSKKNLGQYLKKAKIENVETFSLLFSIITQRKLEYRGKHESIS